MKNTLCELLDQATILGHRKTNKEIAEYLESCGVIVCRQDELPAADVKRVKRGKWIPTGERLPEQGKNVLLCTNGGRVEEGCYFETTEFHTIWKGFVTHGTYWDDEITAWQPLPNPYHAEREDATE